MDEKKKDIIFIRKKVKNHGGGHGGSWKVAYADFVTAMMAFFLLLWLISMSNPKTLAQVVDYFHNFSLFKTGGQSFMEGQTGIGSVAEESGTEDEIVGSINKGASMRLIGSQRKQSGLEEKLISQAKKIGLGKDQIVVETIDNGLRIQIIDTDNKPMFESGSTVPTEKCREILAAVATDIMDMKERISVEGHTDSMPTRGSYTNWDLSLGRAYAAVHELEKSKVDMSRMASVVGYADRMPYKPDDTSDSSNRRISITLLTPKTEESRPLPKPARIASKLPAPPPEKRFQLKTTLLRD